MTALSGEDEKFAQLVYRMEPTSKLLRTWKLQGGVSAQVTAIELVRPDGQTKKLLVRQHGERDRKNNPRIAADEFKLLQFLCAEGLAVPTPYYLDESNAIFSTPYIVIEYIEGETEFDLTNVPDLLTQFTTQLSRIHAVDLSKRDLSFLPQQEQIYNEKLRVRPAKLDESLDEGRIRDVLEASLRDEAAWLWTRRNSSVLLHGDFWPGNILWRDGRLVAVIDWEDARLGDPLADVANTRLEILWAFGIDAMQSFTRQYQAMTTIDFTNLPYWDLCAALRPAGRIAEWAADASAEKNMRDRHRWFISQAFAALSVQ